MSDWIPVSERLPKEHVNVAVLISDAGVAIENYPTCAYRSVDFRGTPDERNVWWAGVPGKFQRIPGDGWEITHWADLPTIQGRNS